MNSSLVKLAMTLLVVECFGFFFLPLIARWDKKQYEKVFPTYKYRATTTDFFVQSLVEFFIFTIGVLMGMLICSI